MLTTSSKHLIRIVLEQKNVFVKHVELGLAEIKYDEKEISLSEIEDILEVYGFSFSKSQDELVVDKIKRTIIDLIYHMNNNNSIVQRSEYLVEMMKMSYDKIARIFRKQVPITLENFIIRVKIERIKELLENDSYSLSEIAFMMDYSSVQHLSSQFKKVTQMTVSEYKQLEIKQRIPLDRLCQDSF